MQGYCDVYKWNILKRASPEVKCLHPTSSRREMCTLSVSNVIYHKFSHGTAFYTLNGKNVNVMLEFTINFIHALAVIVSIQIFTFNMNFNMIKKILNMQVCQGSSPKIKSCMITISTLEQVSRGSRIPPASVTALYIK